MPAKSIVESFGCTDIAEVGGCGAVEAATSRLLGRVAGGHLRHRRAEALVVVHLEDVYLASVARPLGYVGQIELVGQSMDDAALRRGQVGRESHAVAVGCLLEEKEL